MLPEGGFGPPPQEPYLDTLQNMITRARWLFHSPEDEATEPYTVESRKNSHLSVSTDDTAVSSEKTITNNEYEPQGIASVWRDLVTNAGAATPYCADWDEALIELDETLEAICQGRDPIVASTMLVHSIFCASGLPAGCLTHNMKLRHLHLCVRDLGILLHVIALRHAQFNEVATRLGVLMRKFVSVVRKDHEYPLVNREFVVQQKSGQVVMVTDLGAIICQSGEETELFEPGANQDYEQLVGLFQACKDDSQEVCDIIDSVAVGPLYRVCSVPGNDPSVSDILIKFLEARIDLHARIDSGASKSDIDTATQDVLEALIILSKLTAVEAESSTKPAKTSTLFSRSGGLRAGTKSALVEQITRHDQRPEIVHPFLITFSAFMTELELLELLENRYNVQPRVHMEESELKQWKVNVRAPIRSRVIAVIRTWISQYWLEPQPREQTKRDELAVRLRHFAKFTEDKNLINVVERLFQKHRARKTELQLAMMAGISPGSKTPKMSAESLARHLTAIKFEKYTEVTHQCFLWRQIGRVDDDQDTPLGRYIKFWNEETNWVSHRILKHDSYENRAREIEYCIEICRELRKLNNFSSLMAFISAFSSAGLFRLKKTWSRVSREKMNQLDELKALLDSSCNFNNYREVLWRLNEDYCVPFLGLTLMDLQYSYDGNEDFLNGNVHMVNFAKWSVIAAIIDGATRFRNHKYSLKVNYKKIAFLCQSIPEAPHITEQYNLSLAAEPRTLSSKKKRSTSH